MQHPWYQCFDKLIEADATTRILLYGPPGTGKTHRAAITARERAGDWKHPGQTDETKPVYSITLTMDTPAQEVIGHWIPKGTGEFVWHDGPGIRAWREGADLVVNEIDRASDAVESIMHALFDDPQIAQLTLPTGETVRPDEGFRGIATTNQDPTVLEQALLDRFTVRIYADRPAPEAIEHLERPLQQMVINTYDGVAQGGDQSELVSVRQARSFAEISERTESEDLAAEAIFGVRAQNFLDTLAAARHQQAVGVPA